MTTSDQDRGLVRDLEQALGATPGHQVELQQRLAAAADAQDVLDVAYRTVDTPVGTLLLAATAVGLVRVAHPSENHDTVLQSIADRISPRLLHAPARLDRVATEVDEYFGGRRRVFDVTLDWRLSLGFRATVLHHLFDDVGYGQTVSYGSLAQLAGNPGAARAVGTACATNPLPILVPCHRVVRADGAPGGYLGGDAAKRTLLTLEAA